MIFEYERDDPETGLLVTKVASARHDPTSGVVDLTSIFEEGEPGAPTVRWIRRDALRLVGADELRAMAEDAGLVVETLAGELRPRSAPARQRPGDPRRPAAVTPQLRSRPPFQPGGSRTRDFRTPCDARSACYTRPRWHPVTRRASSSSRTFRRWRSTSAGCSTPRTR